VNVGSAVISAALGRCSTLATPPLWIVPALRATAAMAMRLTVPEPSAAPPGAALPGRDRGQDNQIWVGQMAPVIIPKAGPPAGVVGLFQFSTVGWAPIDQTVRSVQM
jgi:hypothetical protein